MSTVEIVQMLLPSLDEAMTRSGVNDSDCFDGRDATRLAMFVPAADLHKIGVTVVEGEEHIALDWTAELVAKQLADDVGFAFTKALNQRGISASCMSGVLKMWHRILQPTFMVPSYAQYGLPMCKMMAVYFDLPNPIGDDIGSEGKYSDTAFNFR